MLVRELPKWDIRVTDKEVAAYIQAMLEVSVDELEEKYSELLDSGRVSDKELRSQIEENIKLQKLRTLIAQTAVVPRFDAKELFDLENTDMKIVYKTISADDAKSALELSSEILGYYIENRDKLENPRRVSVDYIVLEKDSFKPLIRIGEEEARSEYESNRDKYKDETGQQKEFAEVEHAIRLELMEKKARSLAEEKAKLVFDLSSAAEMRDVAEQNGLELLHSGRISEDEADVEGIDNEEEFVRAALATRIGEVSPIIDVGNGFAVLTPTEFYEPGAATPGSSARSIAKKLASMEAESFLDSVDIEIPEKAQARYILLPENYYDGQVEVTEEDLKQEYENFKRFREQRGEEVPPYEEEKERLEKQTHRRKSMTLFREGRKSLECSTIEEFEKIPQKYDPPLEVRTTNYITRAEDVDDYIKNSPVFKGMMFGVNLNEFSRPFRLFGIGHVVLTPIQKRPQKIIRLRELSDIAKKENPSDEEKNLLEEADFSSEKYDRFVESLPDVLNDGVIGVPRQELYMFYDVARQQRFPAESIAITPERKVSYVCVEKENIKDYLNKPFDFEVGEYYYANRSEFEDRSTGRTRSFTDVEKEIEEKLSEKRAEDFEEAVEKYYEEHKDEFKRTVDGKETVPALDEIREEVVEKTREEELYRLALLSANKLPIARGTQMEYQARRQGLVLHESNFFSLDKDSRIDGFLTGSEEDFRNAAFRTPLGEVGFQPVRTEKGYCILSPFAEKPYEQGKARGFAEALSGVEDVWKVFLSSAYAGGIARHISTTVAEKMTDDEIDFAAACEEAGFVFEETDYFKLTDETIAGLEEEKDLIRTISSRLEQRDPTTTEPVDMFRLSSDEVMLYRLVSKKPPSEEEFVANISGYNRRLMSMRGARAYEEWLQALVRESNIEPIAEDAAEKRRMEADEKKRAAEQPE